MIVTALVTGAAAGLKPTAEQVVKDAYSGFKALLQRKFGDVDLRPLEQKPESEAKRASVAEDLSAVGADRDREILEAAQALLRVIEARDPDAGLAVGIDLEQIRAGGAINIEDVIAQGGAIRARDVQAGQDINIRHIRSGVGGETQTR
jgi:hypothetical protein